MQSTPRGRAKLEPTLRDVDVGIVRTLPELDGRDEVREVEALNLAAIAAARHTIYLENQYLAARRLVDALAARLEEDDGPEIVIVLPRRGNNRLEQGHDGRRTPPADPSAVGSRRTSSIGHLLPGDRRRCADLRPLEGDGGRRSAVAHRLIESQQPVAWDSTASAIVAIEADSTNSEQRRAFAAKSPRVRNQLVAEHLGVSVDELESATLECRSLRKAVDDTSRARARRLRPFTEQTVSGEASPLAENDLMDPDHVPRSLTRSVQRFIVGLRG